MEPMTTTEWTCRFVAIEGTLAWAHDELEIQFHIRALGGDRVAVHLELAIDDPDAGAKRVQLGSQRQDRRAGADDQNGGLRSGY